MRNGTTTASRRSPGLDLSGVRSREAMAFVIERERARVERRGGSMALVVFDLHSSGPAVADPLCRAALRRKRVFDEIGWYGEGTIALLLPETDLEGAHVVAETICRMVLAPMSYCIYRYPNEEGEGSASGEPARVMSGREGAMRCQGVFELKPLLLPKVPSWKRLLDVSCSLFGLLLTSPLFAAVALYIKLVSPGPAFFRQERLGKGGKRFQLLKFRSMEAHADSSIHQRHLAGLLQSDVPMTKLDSSHDSRVIPLGNLLRWSCLDELPQLINVLRGEMSLVGPRPCLPYEAERYQLWQLRRLDVLPGITGLWQVSGKNRLTFKQMVRLDIRYGLYPSLIEDLRIMLWTCPTIVALLIDSLKAHVRFQALER